MEKSKWNIHVYLVKIKHYLRRVNKANIIEVSIYQWLTLRWRHNEHDGVSNHQRLHCLLKSLFRCRSKETSELRVTGLCGGNSPEIGEFPAQRASNAENVSIWKRHHDPRQQTPQEQSVAKPTLQTAKFYENAKILFEGNAFAHSICRSSTALLGDPRGSGMPW